MNKIPDQSWTKKDFRVEWFSGTGAGGQHRNKHQNCCRITHIESSITVVGQNHRERSRNFEEAFRELADRVVKWHYGESQKERAPETEVIRTYNQSENRITDHVTGFKTTVDDFELDETLKMKLAIVSRNG
ncbi:MAG: peptide chain release factor-like protein [Anaerolineaceae bacterium]